MAHWTLRDRNGRACIETTQTVQGSNPSLKAELSNPELWWPNGFGDPVLYQSRVELRDSQGNLLDEAESRVGFRRIRLEPYEGTWEAS